MVDRRAALRSTGKGVGIAGAVVGVVAASAAVGLAVERHVVGRLRTVADPAAGEPFGRLAADRVATVAAGDGVALHVQETGAADAPLTVVFVHGWALTSASWHYQWRALARPGVRLVCYDQRSHGESGSSGRDECTMTRLADDLHAVIRECVPHGPIVLAGHSLGGMTILALAGAHPELFRERVVGVAMIATSGGGLADYTLGLPGPVAGTLRRVVPAALAGMRRHGPAVERARASAGDLLWLATRWYAFGSAEPSPSVVTFVEHMITATPMTVIDDFYDAVLGHDQRRAVSALAAVPTLIVCGEDDRITPPEHSRALAEALPDAQFVLVPGAGHMVLLERPLLVNHHLEALVGSAQQPLSHAAERS